MRSALFLILICCRLVFHSQDEKQIQLDSLKKNLEKDSAKIFGPKEFRSFFRYSERNSIANPHPVNFFGPQMGVVVNEYHIFGAGIYLSSPHTRKFYEFKDGGKNVTEGIDMRYATLFYEYILLQNRFYELHLPFEIGYGYYHAAYKDSADFIYRSVNDHLLIASAGVLGIIKPLRWVGFTGSLGYRRSNYSVVNGFYYSIGVWLGIRNLTGDLNYHYVRKKRYHKAVQQILQP